MSLLPISNPPGEPMASPLPPAAPAELKHERPTSSASHDDEDGRQNKKVKTTSDEDDDKKPEHIPMYQPTFVLDGQRFPAAQMARFWDREAWEKPFQGLDQTWETQKLRTGIRSVVFSHKFDIRDAHFEAIASAPAAFRANIISLICGRHDDDDDDKEGGGGGGGNHAFGSRLSNGAVHKLVQACPRLLNLELQSCPRLDDDVLFLILEACPGIRTLRITGSPHLPGGISTDGVAGLRKNPAVGEDLIKLHLMDQDVTLDDHENFKAIRKLSAARPGLVIVEGETILDDDDEDGDGPEKEEEEGGGGGGGGGRGGRLRERVTTWRAGVEHATSGGLRRKRHEPSMLGVGNEGDRWLREAYGYDADDLDNMGSDSEISDSTESEEEEEDEEEFDEEDEDD